nr:unknown [Zea mays]
MATWCSASTNNLKGNSLYFLGHLVAGHRNLCIYDIQEQSMEIVQVHDQEDMEIVRTPPYWINVPPC